MTAHVNMKERSQEFFIYQNEFEFIKSSWHLEASTTPPLCFSLLLAPGHGAVKDRFLPRPLVLWGNQSCVIQNFWVSETCPSSKLQTHSLPFRALAWRQRLSSALIQEKWTSLVKMLSPLPGCLLSWKILTSPWSGEDVGGPGQRWGCRTMGPLLGLLREGAECGCTVVVLLLVGFLSCN